MKLPSALSARGIRERNPDQPPEIVDPPRWPWVFIGLGFFPALTFVLYAMGRVVRSLSGRVTFFGDHPGITGILVWALTGLILFALVVGFRRVRAARPEWLPSPAAAPRVSGPEPEAPNARSGSKRGAFVEGLIYAFVIFLILFPASADPVHRLTGSGDPWNMVWLNWRLADMLKSGNLLPWHIPDAIFPFGLDLRVSDSHLPVAIGTSWALFTPPILAYNLALATGILLNMLAARRLARLFITDRIPVIIVSLAYATAPALVLRTFGHFTLAIAFTAPLLIAEAVEISRGDRQVHPIRIGGLLFLAYLSGIYWLITGGLALGLIVLFSPERPRVLLRRAARLALGGLLTLALMSPLIVQRLQFDNAEAAAGAESVLTHESFYYGGDAYSVFAQPETSTFDAPWNEPLRDGFIPNVLESTVFPGFILLIGLAALLFTRTRLRIPLVVASVGLWLLTLGPGFAIDGREINGKVGWMPFQLLLSVPGLGALRAPNRASFALAAVLTAALALVVGVWWRRWNQSRRVVATGVALVLLALNLQIPNDSTPEPVQADEVAVLATVRDLADPGDTVMIVPGDCEGRVGITSTWQIEHRLPFVGCQGNTASLALYSGMDSYMTESMASFRCAPNVFSRRTLPHDRNLQVLPNNVASVESAFGVRFLLIDKEMLATDNNCRANLKSDSIADLAAWYDVVGETEQLLALDITAGPLGGERGLAALSETIYSIMLRRSPNSDELQAAISLLAQPDQEALIGSIRATAEFHDLNCDRPTTVGVGGNPAIGDAAFVALSYRLLLQRPPEEAGFLNAVAFLKALDSSRKVLVESIVQSPEFADSFCM